MAEKGLRYSTPPSTEKDTLEHEEVGNQPSTVTERALVLEARNDIDPAVEKRIVQKYDLHIIPWLFGIWYDRFQKHDMRLTPSGSLHSLTDQT